jgi:SAM-dependent methyltransferase
VHTGSEHGGTFYDEATTDQYLAHRNAGVTSPNVVMEEPAVMDRLGNLTGLRVLDLGCGDGAFSRTILALGAEHYSGVDGSPAMIDAARATNADPRARFDVGTIEELQPTFPPVDLVTSRMAFHYVADLDGVLQGIRLTLTPAGRLLFTVAHPVITSHDNSTDGPRTDWTVDHYFEPGPRPRTWFGKQVTWYHRTIEQYVSAVLRAGFFVDAISECEPRAQLLADAPEELARRRRVPLMLLISAHRQ